MPVLLPLHKTRRFRWSVEGCLAGYKNLLHFICSVVSVRPFLYIILAIILFFNYIGRRTFWTTVLIFCLNIKCIIARYSIPLSDAKTNVNDLHATYPACTLNTILSVIPTIFVTVLYNYNNLKHSESWAGYSPNHLCAFLCTARLLSSCIDDILPLDAIGNIAVNDNQKPGQIQLPTTAFIYITTLRPPSLFTKFHDN